MNIVGYAISVTRHSLLAANFKTLLHWCDDNTVLFIVDVSRVHANSIPQKIGKKQNESMHTHSISENFLSGTRTEG